MSKECPEEHRDWAWYTNEESDGDISEEDNLLTASTITISTNIF